MISLMSTKAEHIIRLQFDFHNIVFHSQFQIRAKVASRRDSYNAILYLEKELLKHR